MTNFIIRLFVKDYKNVRDTSVRNAYGKAAGIAGIICNTALFFAKVLAGILAGSVSVLADAVNNLSDASSGVISLVGFHLADKPADKEHPYGHGRYEYLAGLLVAIMIIVIGAGLLRESIVKIIKPTGVYFNAVSVGILILSVLVKLWMMLFYGKTGKIIDSKTLKAAATDSRNDVICTAAVLFGVASVKLLNIQVDGWVGILVAAFIIFSGFTTVKDTLDPVLGKAPDKKMIEDIHKKILSYEGVLGAHDLMVHDYGVGRQFASVHVEMSADGDAIAKHEVIDRIERDFLENAGIHMIVHYDPVPAEDSELGTLKAWIEGEIKKLNRLISIHDLHISRGDAKSIELDCVIPQDMVIGEDEIKEFVTNIVRTKYPDCQCFVRIDRSFMEIAD